MGTEFFIAEGVSHVELLAYQVSMVCAGNWPSYLYLSCVYDVISLLICIFYRLFFSKFNTSGNNAAVICKR